MKCSCLFARAALESNIRSASLRTQRSRVRFTIRTSSRSTVLLKRYAMSLLAFLCAYVVGLDTVDNERIRDIMTRSQLAAAAMYANHLRCTPHRDVDSAMAAHDLLRERVRITKVYDVVKDEQAIEMRALTNNTSFVGVSDIMSDTSQNDCFICQSGDNGSSVTCILFKAANRDLILIASGKEHEIAIHRDRASVHAALCSLLKTPPGRLVCTRVARR